MIRITKNGESFALCETPRWIRLQENGCYGLCDENDAQGIAFGESIYNLPGFDIGGIDTVAIAHADGGVEVKTIGDTVNILLGVSE